MYYKEETLQIFLTENKPPIICCGLNSLDLSPAP